MWWARDMADESSIGPWLRSLQDGDGNAMQNIWDQFFEKLAAFGDHRFKASPALKGTGEDLAASVLESLWRGIQAGRFRDLRSRSELWWTLLAMARRKCVDHIRRDGAIKRGGDAREISLNGAPVGERQLFEQLVSATPDPQYLAAVADAIDQGITGLSDSTLQQIAALTLEGQDPAQIAVRLDLSESTVRRKLNRIINVWRLQFRGNDDG
ncbi:MAG: ECF-type sigma factor [Planctomycetaceae bacterium]